MNIQIIKERIAELDNKINELDRLKQQNIEDRIYTFRIDCQINDLLKLKEVSQNLYYTSRGLQ